MSQKFPSLKAKETIRALGKAGFIMRRQKGSHVILKNDATKKMVIIPYHNRDLAIGTLKNIINQSGLSDNEFLDLV